MSDFCPATQEAVEEVIEAGDTGCPLCGGAVEDHLPEDPNDGIEGPWPEGGACGDQYDYQRGALGGWRS